MINKIIEIRKERQKLGITNKIIRLSNEEIYDFLKALVKKDHPDCIDIKEFIKLYEETGVIEILHDLLSINASAFGMKLIPDKPIFTKSKKFY